jgi:hypothetical protein
MSHRRRPVAIIADSTLGKKHAIAGVMKSMRKLPVVHSRHIVHSTQFTVPAQNFCAWDRP